MYNIIFSKWSLVISHFFIKIALIDFRFKCTIWIFYLLFLFRLSIKDRHVFFLFFILNYFLTFRVNEWFECNLIFNFLILLSYFTLYVFLFIFNPSLLLMIVFFSWSDSFLFIFVFNFIHICIKLLFELFILFFLSRLFNPLVFFLFLFSFLKNSFAPHIYWIITNLGY